MLLNAYSVTGQRVEIGTMVKTFRDEPVRLLGLERPNTLGKEGKIVVGFLDAAGNVEDKGYYYASVCGLRVLSPETLHIGTFRETCGSNGCPGCIR
jgi:hypothetical protein